MICLKMLKYVVSICNVSLRLLQRYKILKSVLDFGGGFTGRALIAFSVGMLYLRGKNCSEYGKYLGKLLTLIYLTKECNCCSNI